MQRKIYYGKPKASKVIITLNVIIIVLIVLVLSALGLYSYTFFTGKNPLMKIGIEMPWDEEYAVSQPVVVITEATEETTSAALEASETTVNVLLTEKQSETEAVSVTEPKYSSIEYDKAFFDKSLFIGDSIFTGFAGFGYLEAENVFAQVGLNPESALTKEIDGVTAVAKAQTMQPDYICVMLGTNGLAFLSEDYMAEEMSELIDGLRAASPNSKIVILSIPPVTAEHESLNPEKIPNIIEYNEKIQNTAEEKDCIFIDIFTMLQDEDGYLSVDYAEADGLHFLSKAYGVVLSRIQYELELLDNEEEYVSEEVTVSETEMTDIFETEIVSAIIE